VQLAEIRSTYVVDPVNDLKPVCPNCHAMLHRRTPPYSIDELRALLLRAG
jgi:5-methylcytosine-specific restriction protein A